MEKIYTVILAAGISSRLGYNKLTLKIDGESVIRKAVEPFCTEGIEKIFVVTNPDNGNIRRELEEPFGSCFPSLILVENESYIQGISSSVKTVLPFIEDAAAVFFHLGDKPFIKKETVDHILRLYLRGQAQIIIPEYQGEKGHPVMLKIKPYLEEMRLLTGDQGLREMVDKHSGDVLFIEGEEGNLFDIDTVEDVILLTERGHRIEKG